MTASVGRAEVGEIDRLNVYWAGILALRRAVTGLDRRPGRGEDADDLARHADHDAAVGDRAPLGHQRAGADDIDASLVHRAQRCTLGARHGQQVQRHAVHVCSADTAAVDALRVVVVQPQCQRGDRGDRAGEPDEAASLLQRHALAGYRDRGVDAREHSGPATVDDGVDEARRHDLAPQTMARDRLRKPLDR